MKMKIYKMAQTESGLWRLVCAPCGIFTLQHLVTVYSSSKPSKVEIELTDEEIELAKSQFQQQKKSE